MSIGINCGVSFFFFQLLPLVTLGWPASPKLYFFVRTIYRLKSVVYVKLLNPARLQVNVNLGEVVIELCISGLRAD